MQNSSDFPNLKQAQDWENLLQSREMWKERATELENSLESAIRVIKTLRDRGHWSQAQLMEIHIKISDLQEQLAPF